MADGDNVGPSGKEDEDGEGKVLRPDGGSGPEVTMELVDSLPGGRAVAMVEQDGVLAWLAVRDHVSKQAADEFVDVMTRVVRDGRLVQNWPSTL